jgi:ankyrin repeat protein
LKYGANINDKGRYGNVLIQAVYEKNLELLQYLLEKGADVHLTNHENQTALFIAIAQGQPQMVKLLLEKGSDVSLKDSAGRTAYDFALLKKKDEIAAQILQYGGRIENPEELASEAIQRGEYGFNGSAP